MRTLRPRATNSWASTEPPAPEPITQTSQSTLPPWISLLTKIRPSIIGRSRVKDAVSVGPLLAAAAPQRRIRLVEARGWTRVMHRRPTERRAKVAGERQVAEGLESRTTEL